MAFFFFYHEVKFFSSFFFSLAQRQELKAETSGNSREFLVHHQKNKNLKKKEEKRKTFFEGIQLSFLLYMPFNATLLISHRVSMVFLFFSFLFSPFIYFLFPHGICLMQRGKTIYKYLCSNSLSLPYVYVYQPIPFIFPAILYIYYI